MTELVGVDPSRGGSGKRGVGIAPGTSRDLRVGGIDTWSSMTATPAPPSNHTALCSVDPPRGGGRRVAFDDSVELDSVPFDRSLVDALGAPVGFGERGGRGGNPTLPACVRWLEAMYDPIIVPLRPIANVDCDWESRIARIASVAAVSGETYLMDLETASA